LQQVVWNLLSNAVRFTPSGGCVELTLRRAADEVELQVRDTGCGIPADFLPHVFERFRQADSSTTRANSGLGLGLAIVRDLVELHGGSVRADSEGDGHGSTFTVRLPATQPSGSASWVSAAHADSTRLAAARILVVDDDADTRDVLRAVLEGAGAEVVSAASAPEGRELFGRVRPTVMIADVGMPGEDGYSLIASIRALETGTSHVPAIALSARTHHDDAAQALAAGFQVHLAKPFDGRALVDIVASLAAPQV
jgi:CheY-like chemotaxis protein